MKIHQRYSSLFEYYGSLHSVNWQRLQAQGLAESELDPNAVSAAGAQGLMQFMPGTFAEWTRNLKIAHADPFNPEHSIACGAAYMGWLLKRCESKRSNLLDQPTYRRAWAAYNWGIGNFEKLLTAHPIGETWFAHVPQETRNYIERIEIYLG